MLTIACLDASILRVSVNPLGDWTFDKLDAIIRKHQEPISAFNELVTQVLVFTLVHGQFARMNIPGPAAGGGSIILARNVVFIPLKSSTQSACIRIISTAWRRKQSTSFGK